MRGISLLCYCVIIVSVHVATLEFCTYSTLQRHRLLGLQGNSVTPLLDKGLTIAYHEIRNNTLTNSQKLVVTSTESETGKKADNYWEMTPVERGKFQQTQVERFCRVYRRNFTSKDILDRQMLISDKAKTALCYVPKGGCTTMKVLLFLSLDAIPMEAVETKTEHPDEEFLEEAIHEHSFMAKSEKEKRYILQNYMKFMMYRNPVERLVSGYLSKIKKWPLIGLKDSEPFERNWLRKSIFMVTHPEEFMQWLRDGANTPISIGFPDFIKFWLLTKGISYDEHFQTTFELCQPCSIKYSYYGNFNDFNKEANVFNGMIHGNLSHLMEAEHKGISTSDITSEYYAQIPYEKKVQIITMLAVDLGFYYAIFPAEKGAHKNIMGVDYDVPPLERLRHSSEVQI